MVVMILRGSESRTVRVHSWVLLVLVSMGCHTFVVETTMESIVRVRHMLELTLVVMVQEGIVRLHGLERTRLETIHRRGSVGLLSHRWGPVAHRSYHKGKWVLARDGIVTFVEGR
jgi:hypothetical protein